MSTQQAEQKTTDPTYVMQPAEHLSIDRQQQSVTLQLARFTARELNCMEIDLVNALLSLLYRTMCLQQRCTQERCRTQQCYLEL